MTFLTGSEMLGNLQALKTYVYFDGPKLLLVSNGANQKFLVIFIDEADDVDVWLCVAISELRVEQLESQKMFLREAFTTPETSTLFRISSQGTRIVSAVEVLTPADLMDAQLPATNVYLPLQENVQQAAPDPARLARTLNSEVLIMRMYPRAKSHEAPARSLGRILSSLDSFLKERLRAYGKQPFQDANFFNLSVVGTFAGSFGIEMALRGANEEMWPALEGAIIDLDRARETEEFNELMSGADKNEINSMKAFLHEVDLASTDLSLSIASPRHEEVYTAAVPLPQLRSAVDVLKREVKTRVVNRVITGTLMAINLRTKTFMLESSDGKQRFRGAIRGEIFTVLRKAELPDTYRVALEADVPADRGEDASGVTWRMLSATKV